MISSQRGGSAKGRPDVSRQSGAPPSLDPVKDPPGTDVPVRGKPMDPPRDSDPPEIEIGEIWGRRRIIFLASSAAFVLLVIWMTREVVLPFVLAIIIAYVFTPLVG